MPTINLGKKKPRERTYNKAAYQSVYNTPRWVAVRAAKVREDPLCEECLKEGLVRQVEEVHHIIPIDIDCIDEELVYGFDNLISLCIPHHKEAHRKLSHQG